MNVLTIARCLLKKRISFLALLVCFIFPSAFSKTVSVKTDLAEVVIHYAHQPRLSAVFFKAYRQVLIKMTGNADVVTLPAIKQAALHAKQYVISYQVLKTPLGKQFQLMFDRTALRHLLNQAGQAIWPNQRVLTLLWCHTPSGFLASGVNTMRSLYVKNIAQQRGVPILLPVMDVVDQSHLPQPGTAINVTQLQRMSARYHLKSAIYLVLKRANRLWNIKGMWLYRGQSLPFSFVAHTAQAVLKNAIDHVASMMADRFALLSNTVSSGIAVSIAGVTSLRQYQAILQRLRAMPAVLKVAVRGLAHGHLLLRLQALGDRAQLMQALSAYFLRLPSSETSTTLSYQLVAEPGGVHAGT